VANIIKENKGAQDEASGLALNNCDLIFVDTIQLLKRPGIANASDGSLVLERKLQAAEHTESPSW
jgi:hypothetical protein